MNLEFDKRYAAVGAVILVIVMLGITAIPNIPAGDEYNSRNINDYGTVTLMSVMGSGEVIEPKGTIDAGDDLVCEWIATVTTSDIKAYLNTVSGQNIEKGVYEQTSNTHKWSFTLDGAPSGITECYIAFSGQYTETTSWVGSSYHFFIQQESTPDYPAPEFVEEPDTPQDVAYGASVEFKWQVIYTGPATARFTYDGVTISSRTLTQTTSPQPLSFTYSFTQSGSHTVKLIIEPAYDIAYASEITINVADMPTEPTTSTTTPTTGTQTEPTEPQEQSAFWTVETIVAMGIMIVVILAIIYIQCRGQEE